MIFRKTASAQGLSLIGVVLSIGIGSMLLLAVMLFVTRGFGSSREQYEQVRIAEEARVEMERMSDTIRDARSIDLNGDGLATSPREIWLQTAENHDIMVYTNRDKDPEMEKVRYWVENQELKQQIFDPFSSEEPETVVLARGIRNNPNQPVFTYFLGGADQATPPPFDFARVDRVGITLLIDMDPNQYPPVGEFYTLVSVRAVIGRIATPTPTPSPTPTPTPASQCSDLLDNDSDTFIDFPADPECSSPADVTEQVVEPQCSDLLDNDSDTFIDFPADPECSSPADVTEQVVEPQCSDGIDNDTDGTTDFPADSQCLDAADTDEAV